MTAALQLHLRARVGTAVLRAARNVGPAGLAALALWAGSAVLLLHLTPGAQERTARLDERLRKAAALARTPRASAAPATDHANPEQRFPQINANAADVARLLEIASGAGLNAAKASYRLVPLAGSALMAYEVRLPLSAKYIDLRRFIAESVNQMPNLAVDGISFARADSASESVDAEVRLVLFYRH